MFSNCHSQLRTCCWVLTAWFIVATPFGQGTETLAGPAQQTTEELEWAVVRVGVEHQQGRTRGIGRGTGVLVAREGWFATAGHVPEPPQGFELAKLVVLWPDGQTAVAERVCYQTRPDLGWFLIRQLPEAAMPLRIAGRIPSRFGPLRIVGYPGEYPGTFDASVQFIAIDPVERRISFRFATNPGRLAGLSGGAVIQMDGTLLGVVSSVVVDGMQGFATIVVGQKWCE